MKKNYKYKFPHIFWNMIWNKCQVDSQTVLNWNHGTLYRGV